MSYLLKIHFNIILPSVCNCRKCSRLKYVRKYKLPLVQYVQFMMQVNQTRQSYYIFAYMLHVSTPSCYLQAAGRIAIYALH